MIYDLAVAYRIYPKVTKRPPIFNDNKLKLAELCLQSFKRGLGGLRTKCYVLLDNCPEDYARLFRDILAQQDLELISLPGIGNRPTFCRQIDLLLHQTASDLVYFAEDDYFYRPNALEEMTEFLKKHHDAHFVTPYDHPDAYNLPVHPKRQEVRPFQSRHWRTCASTCLTFLTWRSVLNETAPVFRTYGKTNLDVSLWMSLTKQTVLNPLSIAQCALTKLNYGGYVAQAWRYSPFQLVFGHKWRLWSPLPSLATHMENSFMAPGVDWQTLFKTEGAAKS